MSLFAKSGMRNGKRPRSRLAGPLAFMVFLGWGMFQTAVSADDFTASAANTVVATKSGALVGALDGGIYNYRGVPYAQAERFMPPTDYKPWSGIRPAVAYGENCFIPTMKAVAQDEMFNPHRYMPMSESCLFANVWTPGINDHKKRPIMVWIHGGGYTNGSGIEMATYDGHNLSKKGDVVVVSLNHRLNVLGFLDLSAYGAKYKNSGNASMADLVAALKWVHENAEAFGGDPGNVTIFGQSGGGAKVTTLMAIPAAKGLFAKAIVESGLRVNPVIDQTSSRKVAELTLANLGISGDQVDKLSTIDYATLLAASDKAMKDATAQGVKDARFAPVADGDFIPQKPVETEWTDQAKDIPLLVGNTLNEFETVITKKPLDLLTDNKNGWSDEKVKAKLKERFGEKAEAVGKAFLEAYPEKKLADAYFLDLMFRPGTIRYEDLKARQNGAPVFSYMFAYESPVLDQIGMSWHCSELPYVFANAGLVTSSTGGGREAISLSDQMSQAWINFARNGNPSTKNLPWLPFTEQGGATMIFDVKPHIEYHPDRKLLQAAGAI